MIEPHEQIHMISVRPTGAILVDGIPTGAHCTPNQTKLLRIILSAKHVLTRDFAIQTLYPFEADQPDLKIFDVMVVHLRRKLGNHRAAIDTVWGRGWARGHNYRWAEYQADTIDMPVDMQQLGELAQALDQTPGEVLNDLVRKAYREHVLMVTP